jgi:hypothetical protein
MPNSSRVFAVTAECVVRDAQLGLLLGCDLSNMSTLDDLPGVALRLITRSSQTRHIPGTNRFALISRSWREAALGSEDQEQLQLLLPLEGLPEGRVASTSRWLSQHGSCVTYLKITYDPGTAPLLQRLHLSTAPLVRLARLEVDGPDSLVSLAPALPQLVSLTHLKAGIGLSCGGSRQHVAPGVFSARRVPLKAPPSMQQLCPGLKSLSLDICAEVYHRDWQRLDAPVAQLLPAGLQQLQLCGASYMEKCRVRIRCAALTSFTTLQRLELLSIGVVGPDLLLDMPVLEHVSLCTSPCWVAAGDQYSSCFTWAASEECTTPQHLTKLTGMLVEERPARLPTLIAMATSLGKLELELMLSQPGAAACVQQLSELRGLRNLQLGLMVRAGEDGIAPLLSVSSLVQLTCLCLRGGYGYSSNPRRYSFVVPSSTWAAVLPHLTRLRILGVSEEQLSEEGVVAQVAGLPQLQCLYVADESMAARGSSQGSSAASTFTCVAPLLQVLERCSSLKAVLCWPAAEYVSTRAQLLHEHVHDGRLHLSYWYKWRDAAAQGRVVWPRPCPLPGVWELQQQEPADG